MITIQQERVILRCDENLVAFDWPYNTDTVTVSQSRRPNATANYSIEEAHEIFNALLDKGAY